MANYGLPDLDFVLYRGYDVTGIVLGMSDEIDNPIEDRTAASSKVAVSEFVGTQSGTVEMTGFYDSVLTTAFEASVDNAQAVLMYAIEGNVVGHYVGCVARALKSHYGRSMEKEGLHKGAVGFHANDVTFTIDRAQLVAVLATRTTAGHTQATYADGLAQTTGGGRWYVEVTALTLGGYTNVKAQLQDSADHITFTDVAAGVATFTAIGAQMVAFTGTVKRYLACAWSYTGSGTSPSVTFAAALTKY